MTRRNEKLARGVSEAAASASPGADSSDFTYPAEDWGAGIPEPTDRDFAYALLDLDFEAQLLAIRALLRDNQRSAEELRREIQESDAFARKTEGLANMHAVDVWIENLHAATYQGAAHSMAAVGMLAPFLESIFCRSFRQLGNHLADRVPAHVRFESKEPKAWNCHFVYRKGVFRRDIRQGIHELSAAVGLSAHLPNGYAKLLDCLFEYRNCLFHLGMEWPAKEAREFLGRARVWGCQFDVTTSGGVPIVIAASPDLVSRWVDLAEQIITALGAFYGAATSTSSSP